MRNHLHIADLGDLLEQPLNAVLATTLPGGEILLSPVWHEWRDGGFSVMIPAGDAKERNLRRDPRASLVVAENGSPYRGIEVRGTARLFYNDVEEVNRRIISRYLQPAQATLFLKGLEGIDSVHVRLEPGKMRAWDFTDDEALQ